ncbi:peptidase M9 (plasmid) [Clostridium tetani]|nr:peptidase M9 [Clostridium tetani]
MKKKFIKMLCSIAIGCMISTSYSIKVSAFSNGNTKTNPNGEFKSLSLNSVKPYKTKYSFNDLNKLSNKEILDLTSKIKWSDISDLFQYNKDSYTFYSNKERVQALIDGLYEKGCNYTSTDDKGIDTLVEILRSGFYLGYYNDSLKYLNDKSFKDKCIPAMIAIENNKNFKLGENGQDTVVHALGKLIGNTSCNTEVVNKTIPILEQYYNEIDKYSKDRLKSNAVYNFMKEINYDISQYEYAHNIRDYKNTPWSGKIDSFIDTISKFASISNVTKDNGWIINNSIYYTAKLSKYHSNPSIPHSVIDNCIEIFPDYSEQYFTAIEAIKEDFNSRDSKGNVIDINKLIEEGKKHYLPKTYTFDNGKIIIKAGDKVEESKIQKLYWASKEVKSQFHRIIGNDKPLEVGNADDILTIVIYNNPEEYKLNKTLYGYSVDNGGIYIEGIGTFFTYERTPQESIYSLEELFRHEFTHYLQGRYLIPGLFNKGDFYKGNNGRITWFEEGSAEFFAGSTRTSVLPRKSMVGGLSKNPKERFNADKLLHSKYSDGWDFYKYGYAFSDYMYNNNKKLFSDLVSTMKNNDVKGYEALIEESSKDSKINKDYEYHMENLVNNYDNYTIPLVSDDYMKQYDNKSLHEIKSDIEKAMDVKNSQITKESSQYFDTYNLKATYTLHSNKGEISNWNYMNNKINEALNKLDNLSWGGYKTVTAYFSNPRLNSNNEVVYDIVFHGLLSHNKNSNEKVEVKEEPEIKDKDSFENVILEKENNDSFDKANKIHKNQIVMATLDTEDYRDTFYFDALTSGSIDITIENIHGNSDAFNWLVYNDEDLNNYIAYPTKKEDNKLMGSFKVHKPGRYYILVYKTSLNKVNYKLNISDATNMAPVIKKIHEKENNDSFETANKITLDTLVLGNLDYKDVSDIYSFDIENTKDLNIKLTNLNNLGIAWNLYKESDLNNYIAYGAKSDNAIVGKCNLSPGKYYLYVYKYSGDKGNYSVIIN